MLIAICGGIGSGKSQVSARLRALGYRVIDADQINKELLCENWYLDKLRAAFPACFEKGELKKEKLKNLVFSNENERKKLNAIAHPEIAARLIQKAEALSGVVFAEIPLLFESGMSLKGFNHIWAVVTDREKRIARIMKREGITKELAAKMIDAQQAETKAEERADFVIDNNGDLESLLTRVDKAVKELSDA